MHQKAHCLIERTKLYITRSLNRFRDTAI